MMSNKILILSVGAVLAATVAWGAAPAAGARVNTSAGLTATGAPLALHGHDPVAYFTDGEPTVGDARFSAVHDGATYRFASAEHQALFESDPSRYLPAFGGFCAYGVTVGKKFDGDPRQWAIHGGTLYLNLNAEIGALWRDDVAGHVAKARSEWAAIRDVAPADL